jgi:DNA-binding beta-propeller fold protein YncE
MPTRINPFPGLRSFESQDSELFFGRESHIRELRRKLSATRFLAIVASSGSGKSSLIKAGLVPSLLREKLGSIASEDWNILLFKPGATPIRSLAEAIQKKITGTESGFDALEVALRKDAGQVPDLLRRTFPGQATLLVIDQFEEVFRYGSADESSETGQLIGLIMEMVRQPDSPVYVVLTMRSDYLDDCTNYEGFTEMINRGYYLLPKMNPQEIRQAIVRPIEAIGASITPELADRLIDEIGSSYDRLPVLQHALMRTWDYWENQHTQKPIDQTHFEAIGTMQEAISRHAEEVYHALPDDKSRLATEKLFKSLIELAPGDVGIMRPARLRQIMRVTGLSEELLTDVINRLRQQGVSILTPSYTQKIDPESFIDISLEKIMILWERLRGWISEETESAKLYRKIGAAAQLNQAGKTGLLVNPELQLGIKWLRDEQPTLEWAEKYDPYFERAINYLDNSLMQYEAAIKDSEDKQKRELKRARYFAIVMGVGSLMSLLFLVISLVLRYDAEQSRKQSVEKEKLALSERKRAEEQTRESISQKRIAEQQETIAEEQRLLTEEQRAIAVREQRMAEVKRLEAEIARGVAIVEKTKADSAQKRAEMQKDLAVKSRALADLLRIQADSSRSQAQASQKDAETQRGRAVARSVAIQSYQMSDNSQEGLPALLAAQAFRLNLRTDGRKDNPDIFRALAKVADTQTILRWHSGEVRTVIRQPGSTVYASAGDDGTVKVWDADLTRTPGVRTFPTGEKKAVSIRTLAFSADGGQLFAGSSMGTVYSWQTAKPLVPPQAIKAHRGVINSALVNPASSQLVTVSGDGAVRTWKITAMGLDSLQNIQSGVELFCARLTPDGKYLACGASNGRVILYDLADLGKKPAVYTYYGFGNRVTALAFSPDGNSLITANSTGMLHQWGFSGKTIDPVGVPLSGRHTSPVNDIVFSPDGSLLATCSYDWTVHLWNYESIANRQVQPIVLDDFDTWVFGVAFSKDSKKLIACGADRTVRVWDVDPDNLYQQVLRKVDRDMTPDEWNRYIGRDVPYEKSVKRSNVQ